MKNTIKIPDYPIKDHKPGHHPHYVLYPIEKRGKWRAAEVIEGGYKDPFKNPAKNDFATKEECQKAIDSHHNWLCKSYGLTPERIKEIIELSFLDSMV